jgi:hypothetical protein
MPATRRAVSNWKPTDEPFDVEAELRVGFGGLEEAYVSKVTGRPFEMVRAEAAEEAALFKSLVTTCMSDSFLLHQPCKALQGGFVCDLVEVRLGGSHRHRIHFVELQCRTYPPPDIAFTLG